VALMFGYVTRLTDLERALLPAPSAARQPNPREEPAP